MYSNKIHILKRLYINLSLFQLDCSVKILAKKMSLSTDSGLKHALRHVTMFPPLLKSLSDDAFVAGMERYFLANLLTLGKFVSCTFHHRVGQFLGLCQGTTSKLTAQH